MNKAFTLFKSILLLTIVLTGCKKEDINSDLEFCSMIAKEEYNQTGPIIDRYLKGLNKNLDNSEKLEQIRNWLADKSCVSNVKIFCNSCVDTYPAQSEIYIRFLVNGQQVEKVLDIVMSEPLRFRTFHE